MCAYEMGIQEQKALQRDGLWAVQQVKVHTHGMTLSA
jgi:hypothetical protein